LLIGFTGFALPLGFLVVEPLVFELTADLR